MLGYGARIKAALVLPAKLLGGYRIKFAQESMKMGKHRSHVFKPQGFIVGIQIHSLRETRQTLHDLVELSASDGIESLGQGRVDGSTEFCGRGMQGSKNRSTILAPLLIPNGNVHNAPIQLQHVDDRFKFDLQGLVCLISISVDLPHDRLPC
jgi:hypothetical protein